MKLSTKIILPIIIISALLILLNGCISTVPDDSPGYTPGTITGIIASPCCSLSSDPANGETASPEYWCYYCQNTWDLQDGIEVVLTYGEDEVATTTTNDKGEFTFTDVPPGRNYVITAYCPDFSDNRPLVKDVALELIEGGSFDTKTTDLVSTSLGLVVDFLVLYTELGPEDILLEGVIADKPNFPNFPKFKKLVYEVRRVLENCEVNMLTDDDLQDALCFASEEVGRETDPDLVIGCSPGYTPPPPPTPGACDGNLSALIDSVSIDGVLVDPYDTVNVILGESYDIVVTAHDQDTKLGTLTYYAKANGFESPATTSNQVIITPPLPGTFEVFVYVHDGCAETEWGPVTVEVHDECYLNEKPSLIMPASDAVDPGGSYSWSVTASDDGTKDPLSFTLVSVVPTPTNDFTVDPISGEISWDPACDDIIDGDRTFTVTVEVTDGCEPVQGSFDVTLYAEPCLCTSADLSSFSFEIQEGSLSWNEHIGSIYPFAENTTVYNLYPETFASHFRFTVTVECEGDATLFYNWFRGESCTDKWLTGELGYDNRTKWIEIVSGGTYPTSPSEQAVCTQGGNQLLIRVLNVDGEKIYTVNVNRTPQGQ